MDTTPRRLTSRPATVEDLPVLIALVDEAIDRLQVGFVTPEQIESSHAIMGIDPMLLVDGTYYVVESAGRVAGCGGWSRRATLLGTDDASDAIPAMLDPRTDAAKVRALYTHPDMARRGVARLLVGLSETAAVAEGFRELELVSTLAGVPLFEATGYAETGRFWSEAGGVDVPLVRMRKRVGPRPPMPRRPLD